MASTFITKANPTANTDSRKKGTISFWFKRSGTGATQYLYTESSDGNNAGVIYLSGSDTLNIISYDGGSSQTQLSTNRKFRDCTGWIHFHFAYDSTLGTADDRQKLWINGEQITSFSSRTNPSQDGNFWFGVGGTNYPIRIGRNHSGDYFNGYMSHFHRVDSQALAPTIFGSTDTTTGQWKIATSPSITYTGTSDFNFFILKDSNSVTDQSGEGNDLTIGGGTLTSTQDNPSNVFATLNPEECGMNSGATPTNGNTTFGTSAAQWHTEASTFGITRGKYYWETQMRDAGGDRRMRWGMVNEKYLGYTGNNKVLFGSDKNAIGWKTNGESATDHGYGVGSSETTLSGDINEDNGCYGFAIDYDNQLMWGSYNGTWLNSGNPSAGTGGVDVSSYYNIGDPLFPCWTTHNSYIDFNAGNGVFASTALTGTTYNDADGNGIFKYSVPTNFRALCSKGINQ